MVNSTAYCKDQDGILPIQREAWELIAPMPSTTGIQSKANAGSNFFVPGQSNNPPKINGVPSPNTQPPFSEVPYHPENNFASYYSNQGFPQEQFSFNQSPNPQFGPRLPSGQFPIVAPIYWYYPYCQQCQQFGNHGYR